MKCLPNGTWSTPPTCHVIRCQTPSGVNGTSTYSNWTREMKSNATLEASCYPGYNMSGNATMKCLPNGTWSTPPTCHVIRCQTPPGVNGTSTFINWTGEVKSNATLEASCYPGYNMSGNATMKCLPNGTWSTPPTCHVIRCQTPPGVNGTSTFINWTGEVKSNATLEASCYPGYNMSGNATMKCLPSGTWSTSPSCNVIQCEVPAFTNGNVQPPPPVYANKSVTFACKSGFKLIGNSTSKCNYNGSFDHVPICQLIKPNSIQSENIDIKNLSESSISVIWTRPGHVSGYNVTFRCISPNENSTIAPVLQTTVDKEEASVNGLDPGSFCNVSVQTFLNNGIYRILYGSVTQKHLQNSSHETAPREVRGHNISSIGSRAAVINWLTPSIKNGVIRNYITWIVASNNTCLEAMVWTCSDCSKSDASFNIHTSDISQCSAVANNTFVTSKQEFNWFLTTLHPYRNYTAYIAACTVKLGTKAHLQIITLEDNPDVVNTTSSFSVYARNATMNWTDPCFKNGILKRFYVELLNSSSAYFMNETWASYFETNASTHELLLMELLPFRNYSVRVKAANNAGNGTYNVSHIFMTNIDVPMAPSDLRQGSTNSSYVRINWNKTMHYTGPTKYIINVTDDNDNVPFTSFVTHEGWWIDQLATHVELFDLDAFWKYSIAVTAETSYQNQGPLRSESTKVIVQTAESVPGRLHNLSAVSELDVSKPPMLYVNWLAPIERDRNGIIVGYEIYCSNRNRKFGVSASTLSHNITMYIDNKSNVTVEVRAATSVGYGEPFTVTVEVKPGAPEVPPETPSNPLTKIAQIPVADDKKMIAVQLSQSFLCSNKTGAPVQWGVIVAQESKATDLSFVGSHGEYQTRKNIMYKKWSEVKDMDDIPPYLATGPHWSPSCIKGGNKRRRRAAVEEIEPFNFIIGSEDCSNNQEYCNGPLQPGRSYRVKSFACTSSGCTETLYSQPIKTGT
ncbi:phosphatidylinositol phosphatase PTPRQ-like [Dreissena polymorpha]|uniref:phosphatidylinositol phosphatase PTPRQ-like n=1 Tax=Dreissena polymorpha TaxID=45954 RepID=UPI002264D01D|nr:phosphatidylinositol phosphatase PTPRQ-like [Dreissena polymorpha]